MFVNLLKVSGGRFLIKVVNDLGDQLRHSVLWKNSRTEIVVDLQVTNHQNKVVIVEFLKKFIGNKDFSKEELRERVDRFRADGVIVS